MTFAERLIKVRKERKLSQGEAGKLIGINGDALGRYERGEVSPKIEIAGRIAAALKVPLDYLVGNTDTITDTALLEKVAAIQGLPDEDRRHLLFTLDALIRDAKARQAYA